jgi:type II secretory pathway component PulJ
MATEEWKRKEIELGEQVAKPHRRVAKRTRRAQREEEEEEVLESDESLDLDHLATIIRLRSCVSTARRTKCDGRQT